jgi:uncharacterized protein (TIGR03437 family)
LTPLLALALLAPPALLERTGKVPVVLLNGWALTCSDGDKDSTGTFGRMEELLRAEGYEVRFFNNCEQAPGAAIETLAARLREYLDALRYADGKPVELVDAVSHSMGALILRAYLSGKDDTGFRPPIPLKIRKAVFIAAPHWGASFFGITPNQQARQMATLSQFLWDLATWNQQGDDLRGIQAIGLHGTAGLLMEGDGSVTLLNSTFVPSRVLPYCHSGSVRLLCRPGSKLMAEVDGPDHLSWRIVRSFLAGTSEWTTLGGDLNLKTASLCVTQTDNEGRYYPPGPTTASIEDGPLEATSGSYAMCRYGVPRKQFNLTVSYQGQVVTGRAVDLTNTVGMKLVPLRPDPRIVQVDDVAAGGRITIRGAGFVSGARVFVDDTELPLLERTETQITTRLPLEPVGLRRLSVRTAAGAHTINVLVLDLRPSIAAAVNAASYQPGFAPSSWVTLFGANLDNARVLVAGREAIISYAGPTQINLLTPDLPGEGPVDIEVITAQGNARYTGQLQRLAPALFTFGVEATYKPAAAGQGIELWLTGAAPQPAVEASIGGRPAAVFYAGQYSPGVLQVNCYVPDLPEGDYPVQVRIGGFASQNQPPVRVRRSL